MSLVSPCKKEDLEMLAVWADIIETTHRIYKKKGDAQTKEYLEGFINTYQELKHKIDNHDYTEDDRKYWEFEKLFTGGVDNISPVK